MISNKYLQTHVVVFLLMLVLCLPLSAQDLMVKSMEQVPDATASMFEYQLADSNGDYAGIVKVLVALDGVTFDGGGVLKQQKIDRGEYWVWMAKNATRLTIRAMGYLPLSVNFRDYENVNVIHSKSTYRLVLTIPSERVNKSDNSQYLIFNVIPKDAMVKIDNKPLFNENGVVKAFLPMGTYKYEVAASGYSTKKGDVVVGSRKEEVTVVLESLMGQLRVECPTPGAQVYVNDDLKGSVPWVGSLVSGYYKVEVRLDGYHGHTESVYLSENESRSVSFSALSARTGSLNIDYQPYYSDIFMDGKKVGNTPDIFRDLVVGSHKVEIRKEGYETAYLTAVVKENESVTISGKLETLTSVPSSTASPSGIVTFYKVNGVPFRMVRVEGESFQMGATKEQGSDAYVDEKPVHSVTLSGYMIGETEVTQELWEAVMGSNPSKFKGAKNPVEQVSWKDCHDFIEKLNQLTGEVFRLPTEAEWEFAARGGNSRNHNKFSGSNKIDDVAWYEKNSGGKPHAVGQKRPNELGLYDMSGNVKEWCEDWYDSYSASSQTNPKGAANGSYRVYRGGSWSNDVWRCRVSNRNYDMPDFRLTDLGFRLAH